MVMDVDEDSLSSEQSQIPRFPSHSHVAQQGAFISNFFLSVDPNALQTQLGLPFFSTEDTAQQDKGRPVSQDFLNMSFDELQEFAFQMLKGLSEPLTDGDAMQVSTDESSPPKTAPGTGQKRKRVGVKCGYGLRASLRESG